MSLFVWFIILYIPLFIYYTKWLTSYHVNVCMPMEQATERTHRNYTATQKSSMFNY